MTTCQTYGRIRDRSNTQGEYLTLAFSPLSVPLRSRWRNNGLSADFLGDYVLTFLPSEGGFVADGATQNEIKHAVVFIANELLENAMKYHQKSESTPIDIHMELTSDFIAVSARNTVSRDQAQKYRRFIESLMQEDASELLMKQLEINASGGNSSCLGLLTMVNDYGAELGWQFENGPADQESTIVTTSALVALNRIVGVTE